ncbi:hypothetical protein ELY33_14740 [Vreelandella andesensis]|uniref:Uncharacterized protein n=1 Tax=Vreelandella andesensis TaxID=447567 RepID=A0A3S0VZY7_9GAMM|nr:hypothetical protein [Halomonas andesensis]RUR27846.1 hypothetical protein ELY33_14740 [Halomonas andesensis]
MNKAEKLYRENIFNSKRVLSKNEVSEICDEILSSSVSLEVFSSTLSVYTYKKIEMSDASHPHFIYYESCIQKLLDRLEIDSEAKFKDKNVRQDEFQLVISLITSRWHWLIFSEHPLQLLLSDLEKDFNIISAAGYLKESYSLNIFKTLLFLSAINFVCGNYSRQLDVASSGIAIYKRIVENMERGKLPSSSHFSDLASANNAIEVMLSGVEWVNGERFRKERWNPSRIMHASSRINLTKCPGFMDKGLKIISSSGFNEVGL